MQTQFAVMLRLIGRSFRELSYKDPLRLAGATAFFTTFALPAILLIVVQMLQLIFSRRESNRQLYDKLNDYVGEQSASHLINVLEGFEKIGQNPVSIILVIVFLMFVATTLFKVIKNSINDLWDIEIKRSHTPGVVLLNRFRELVIILSAGTLLLITLFLEGIMTTATKELLNSALLSKILLNEWTGNIISTIVVAIWFGIIFSFLPDGRISIRICFTGAFITAILFNIGKVLIKRLLLNVELQELFGKSSAVVLLLLFVFYSSLLFYFGAMYTKLLAGSRHISVKPLPHAKLKNKK